MAIVVFASDMGLVHVAMNVHRADGNGTDLNATSRFLLITMDPLDVS
ncbi:MAG: hypothetical protein AVDCRST_MAG31-1666 [uncultured Sphingomonas sp.]|uniref:Uncharacterized protein n=1 Tax=uncultured Sphingomonas sp. TaxID=158754 RepID=A0A6J4TFE9_9SPHN|nr:MAG: hypothetical protein AVDCRST_MAG31-1666 [uncultured Sphingomonas sp.]